jgi:hypothetical protein
MRVDALFVCLALGFVQFQAQGRPNPDDHLPKNQQSAADANAIQSARARNSHAASDLLNAAIQARNAVAYQDKQDAFFHINHGLQSAKEVLDRSNIRYVPIYAELSRYSVIEPIMEQAKAETGLKQTGAEEAPTVQSVVGEYTSVSLDIQAAKDHFEVAKGALESDNFQKADAALKAVPKTLAVAAVAADLPLLRARQNLMLARRSAIEEDTTQAQAALKEASEALATFGKIARDRSQEVTKVRTEIDNFTTSAKDISSDAVEKIDAWWEEVTGWITDESTSG